MPIPKIIHQIWTQGCDKIPEKYHKYIEGWKNKGYKYMCWSDESIKELLQKYDESLIQVYDYFILPQQRSDFGRYLILYLYGGFYIDIDIEAGNESLDILLDKNKLVTGIGMHGIKQSFMGSVPFNPIFKDLIDHIRESYIKKWYDFIDVLYVNRTTGGEIYKTIVERYKDDVYKIQDENQTPQCNLFDDDCSNKNEKYSKAFSIQHSDETWNIFFIINNFIKFYRYVMLATLLFLIYLVLGNCSTYGINTLCRFRNIIIILMVLTTVYSIFFLLLKGKFCRTSLLYFMVLIICYFSLSKKCTLCNIQSIKMS